MAGNRNLRGEVAIVGVGEVPAGKYPERSAREAAGDAMQQALNQAGLSRDDIDVLMPSHVSHDPTYNFAVTFGLYAEEWGMQGKVYNQQIFSGGGTGGSILKLAAGLIVSGQAETVLAVYADRLGTGRSSSVVVAGDPQWEVPFGVMTNVTAAMFAERYMHETGTTPEQLASVCVSLRRWAQLNPNAMFRKPLSVEEVLASRMITSPFHMYECNVLADGAAAMIITSAERARELTSRPAYLLGTGAVTTHFYTAQCPDLTRMGWAEAAARAYAMSGLGPGDFDFAEIYDAYPVFPLITLEGLGLVPRGEAGRFVADGHTLPGGRLPMTTNGGLLSGGHTGTGAGIGMLVETARQLMGNAGERQVPDARFAIDTAMGGDWSLCHVAVLGNEVP